MDLPLYYFATSAAPFIAKKDITIVLALLLGSYEHLAIWPSNKCCSFNVKEYREKCH